jgi:hypothetical protein
LGSVLSFLLLFTRINNKIYEITILRVVLCGYETWSLSVGEEHSLRVVEYSVPKKIFGRTWGEVTGDWRVLHTGEHHDLFFSRNFIRVIELRIT